MFIELIDILRCTAAHDDTPLVASIAARADRDIVSGLLGCPLCGAEYPIENGVALFGGGSSPGAGHTPEPYAEANEEIAMRCAAMLNLSEPGGVAVLGGVWSRGAAALLELTRTSLLLIEPPPELRLGAGISAIRVGTALPLAASSVRGIALDAPHAEALVATAARALQPGGRLIAPVATAIPAGIAERARDDRHWVGEAEAAASAPIQLARGLSRRR